MVSPCSDASHGMDAGAWASVAAAAVGRARLQIMEDAEIRVEAEAGSVGCLVARMEVEQEV